MKSKRITYIELLKTVAMFSVIMFHSVLFFTDNPFWPMRASISNNLAIGFSNFFDVFSVPIFVFASGFLFSRTVEKNNINELSLIRKKAIRILVPFVIYGVLWLVPTYTILDIPSYGRDAGTSLLNGYKALALGQFCDLAWFLLMLFWVTLIWSALKRMLNKDKVIIATFACVILYLAAHYGLASVNYYKLSQIDIYIPIFLVGIEFYNFKEIVEEKKHSKLLLIITIVCLIICVYLSQIAATNTSLKYVLRIIVPVLMCMLFIFISENSLIKHIEELKAYRWLVDNSMYLYLMHAPGVYVAFRIISPLLGEKPWLCIISIFIITVFIDIVLVNLLNLILKHKSK